MNNELLTVEGLKNQLRKDLDIKEYNRNGIIKYAGFLIVCDLENEIKQKNDFRKNTKNSYLDNIEFEKMCDLEFLINCGVLNYYREVKKIFFVKNTPENRKVVYKDYKFHKYHEIKILNTNIYIEIEKNQNYFILSYNNNRYKFYKINNNLYMYETEWNNSIRKISLNRLIKGEKTRELIRDILKAITE